MKELMLILATIALGLLLGAGMSYLVLRPEYEEKLNRLFPPALHWPNDRTQRQQRLIRFSAEDRKARIKCEYCGRNLENEKCPSGCTIP